MALFEITDELIGVYQAGIDALINQLGKTVEVRYPPKITDCNNCVYDSVGKKSANVYSSGGPAPFVNSRICPVCMGTGKKETFPSENITCLIEQNPRNYKKYNIEVRHPDALYQLKTYASQIPKILKAVEFIVDADTRNIDVLRCKLVREPIMTGLRESRYCLFFVELIDA
jgi:hypothetical protein